MCLSAVSRIAQSAPDTLLSCAELGTAGRGYGLRSRRRFVPPRPGAGPRKPGGTLKNESSFDPQKAAKKLVREARSGALATLMPGPGDPYCSLVNVATTADG